MVCADGSMYHPTAPESTWAWAPSLWPWTWAYPPALLPPGDIGLLEMTSLSGSAFCHTEALLLLLTKCLPLEFLGPQFVAVRGVWEKLNAHLVDGLLCVYSQCGQGPAPPHPGEHQLSSSFCLSRLPCCDWEHSYLPLANERSFRKSKENKRESIKTLGKTYIFSCLVSQCSLWWRDWHASRTGYPDWGKYRS